MKCALITGASRGIGRACALSLFEAGNNLILVAKEDEKGLEETKALILERAKDKQQLFISTRLLDVSDSKAIKTFFEDLKEEGIQVEILVNNAAIAHFDLVQDTSDEDWRKVLSTNLDSVFYMTREALPQMIHEKRGKIINISSYWGIKGAALESAYAASKGGVNAFTLSVADEVSLSGIEVNAIAAEFVDTKMNGHLSEEEAKEAASLMPSGKIAKPEEIGRLVAKLSESSCKITGRIIAQDEEF